MGDSLTFSIKFSIKKIFMSPDKLVDENDPSSWVAKTKVAPVKFTKWFLLVIFQFSIKFVVVVAVVVVVVIVVEWLWGRESHLTMSYKS